MINFDDFAKENMKEHSSNLRQICDYPHILLIIRRCGSGKNKYIT